MSRRTTILMTIFAALCCGSAMAAEKPNIIVILVDDLGWMDLSCQGSDYYKTPAIDRLAAEGIRFTDGYAACAVCSPTRAAVQTGRYPHRVGVTDWIRSLFQRGETAAPRRPIPPNTSAARTTSSSARPIPSGWSTTKSPSPRRSRAAGYQSGYIGKWHLGDPAWYPPGQGYDENRGGCDYGQPPSYFDPYNQPKGKHESLRKGIPDLPGRKPGEYLTDREADEAVALIRGWHAEEQPFFLQVAHYAVHTPIQAIQEVAAKYEREGKNASNAKYAAMVESVDDSTRQILGHPEGARHRQEHARHLHQRQRRARRQRQRPPTTPRCAAARASPTRAASACRSSSAGPA